MSVSFLVAKAERLRGESQFVSNKPQTECTMPQREPSIRQPACSSLTSWKWAWNAQFCGSHENRCPCWWQVRHCHCLAVPLGRECDPFHLCSLPQGLLGFQVFVKTCQVWGMTGLQEMKNGLNVMKSCIFHLVLKWAQKDTKWGGLNPSGSIPRWSRLGHEPRKFQESQQDPGWKCPPFLYNSSLRFIQRLSYPRTTALQQAKSTSNTQVLSGRQPMNNQSSSGTTPSLSRNHKWVLGWGSHSSNVPVRLLQIGNAVQWLQTLDDGKKTHTIEMTSKKPIHSPKTNPS